MKKDAKGHECFDKVCEKLRLYEKDYFGLRYKGAKGTEIWLNLRNPLTGQVHGKQPYRFWFLVKYFVKPQELQQEITRHQYFLTLKLYLRRGRFDLTSLPTKSVAQICAALAQAEIGDFNPDNIPDYSTYIPFYIWSLLTKSCDLKKEVAIEHNKLVGQCSSVAEVNFLHLLSTVHGYGIETFNGKYTGDNYGRKLKILVDNDGIKVYSIIREYDSKQGREVVRSILDRRILYEEVSTVSYSSHNFTVVYGTSENVSTRVVFKLKNEIAAVAMFRSFTEFHTFFNCNSVKKSVIDQMTRTTLGKFVMIFHPNSTVGEMFLFDITRTRRQAYSHAWKFINSQRNANTDRRPIQDAQEGSGAGDYRPVQSPLANRRSVNKEDMVIDITKKPNKFTIHENLDELPVAEIKKIVRDLEDSRICQVCMDEEVATAFCPCGHVVCCVECSVMCRECPICRSQITYAQRVFFSCD